MQTATQEFLTESEKTVEGARPAVEIVIETAAGLVSYGNRVTSVSDVDRVLEKYGEQGIGFAGDITFTLENTDGIFSAGNASSPFEGQVRGRQVAIYQFFYTKEPTIIPFMTTAKGMTTTVDMDEGTTEKLPQFVGKISRVITNDDRTVTITVRDIIQDLVEAEMGSTGVVSGNVADGLKFILEAAGFDVNVAAYELLRNQTAGTKVARAWSSGDKAIDLVQDLNKACGTNVVANAVGEMVMTQLFPHWGEFARLQYRDQSLEPEYSGDESDVGVDLNIITANGSGDETFTVNRVTFTFKDFDGVDHTQIFQVPSSILKYNIKNLPLATGASIDPANAYVWPTRILDRYNDESATLYSLRTSLRHASVAEVGDHVTLTEPSGMEVETFALITRASRNPFVMTAGMEFETQREMQDEKWAFAGDAAPGGSERPSDIMDYCYNKSFEAADAAPGDLTPTKWTKETAGSGTFERSTDYARTGQYSVKMNASVANDSWKQDPLLVDLQDSTQYAWSVWYRGAFTAGYIRIRIVDSLGGIVVNTNVSVDKSDWFGIIQQFTTNANGPFYVRFEMVGFNGTVYFDDFQIDLGALAKDFQENWLHYAYAGEAADQASPGFDLEGNNNGVIDPDYMNGFEQEYVAF